MQNIGVIIIGRNEGGRLKRCLGSVQVEASCIVYVDSASSDGSVAYARSIGVDVVELDMSIPFSAGRARNEGFSLILKKFPDLKYVQFIDGDCELSKGWLSQGIAFMEKQERCAIVAGRRKEKYPEKSIYNYLCDVEWNTAIGETSACGGDFMVRTDAFQQVGGFNASVIAGEEPELCYRMQKKMWTIYRLDHPMTIHDAAITEFSQWWKRAIRSGHAYAQGYVLHRKEKDGYCYGQSLRIWIWAFFIPLMIIWAAISVNFAFVTFFSVYLIQCIRIAVRVNARLRNTKRSLQYAVFITIAKWAQFIGQIVFMDRVIRKKRFEVIEYQ